MPSAPAARRLFALCRRPSRTQERLDPVEASVVHGFAREGARVARVFDVRQQTGAVERPRARALGRQRLARVVQHAGQAVARRAFAARSAARECAARRGSAPCIAGRVRAGRVARGTVTTDRGVVARGAVVLRAVSRAPRVGYGTDGPVRACIARASIPSACARFGRRFVSACAASASACGEREGERESQRERPTEHPTTACPARRRTARCNPGDSFPWRRPWCTYRPPGSARFAADGCPG